MIQLSKIHKVYNTGDYSVSALNGIDLDVEHGEFVAIMGPSGSGKSTLLHILGCLDRPTSGRYVIDGATVGNLSDDELAGIRGKKIGVVFQFFNLFPNIPVIRNMELPMIFAGEGSAAERRLKATRMLKEVGIEHKAPFLPGELSGGQQQMVAIARAMVQRPPLLLADEPTGNLDTKSAEKIMEIFKKLNSEGTTIVMVTHEENIARYARRIVGLRDGSKVRDEKY